jgi:hypothetical protein
MEPSYAKPLVNRRIYIKGLFRLRLPNNILDGRLFFDLAWQNQKTSARPLFY